MSILFGKKKVQQPPPVDHSVTISTIRSNLELLEKREQHLTKRIEMCLEEAKQKASRKDKNGALFCLKRKKMLEAEINKLQGARLTLENQQFALESAVVNIEVFKTMEQGTKAMKAIRGNIDADKVDDLMTDMQEEKETADAISDAIARPAQDLFDDQELLDELAELEAGDLDEQLLQPAVATKIAPPPVKINASTSNVVNSNTSVFNLPVAPTGNLAATGTNKKSQAEMDEEEELRQLQASMM